METDEKAARVIDLLEGCFDMPKSEWYKSAPYDNRRLMTHNFGEDSVRIHDALPLRDRPRKRLDTERPGVRSQVLGDGSVHEGR